ncbi:hypothetical protein ElyMa_006648500 [Elysia marginata]|uniref:Uncharacterized protein n=1 Tax=Elysia marginata TaxID=1093978 RepID=A0AAV4IM56_9GAST|nr:hypothetical protein ElyMa_006648500 [Elysia marginata]
MWGSVAEWLAHRTQDLEVREFDSRACHVAIALKKQFILTFPSPLTCKMGTQLQAVLEFVICACNTLHHGFKVTFRCTGLLRHYWRCSVATQLR